MNFTVDTNGGFQVESNLMQQLGAPSDWGDVVTHCSMIEPRVDRTNINMLLLQKKIKWNTQGDRKFPGWNPGWGRGVVFLFCGVCMLSPLSVACLRVLCDDKKIHSKDPFEMFVSKIHSKDSFTDSLRTPPHLPIIDLSSTSNTTKGPTKETNPFYFFASFCDTLKVKCERVCCESVIRTFWTGVNHEPRPCVMNQHTRWQ